MADIALIKLRERVTYDECIHPIALVDTADQFLVSFDGSECVITGWGYSELNDDKSNTSSHPGRYFADGIFRTIFVNEKFCILIKISLKYTGIDIYPALV